MGAGTIMIVLLCIAAICYVAYLYYNSTYDYSKSEPAAALAIVAIFGLSTFILVGGLFASCDNGSILERKEVLLHETVLNAPNAGCVAKIASLKKLEKHNRALKKIKQRNSGFYDWLIPDHIVKKPFVRLKGYKDMIKTKCKKELEETNELQN